MPADLFESAEAALFQQRAMRVVPLVAVFDDSTFGKASRREFELARLPAFTAVNLSGSLAEASELLERTDRAGYRTSIHPLELVVPAPPTWVFWFEDLTVASSEKSGEALSRFRQKVGEQRRFHEFFVLKVNQASDAAAFDTSNRPEGFFRTTFLVGERGSLLHDVDTLAGGVAHFALAGWQRFLTLGDLDIDRALFTQGGGGRTYVLGCGSLGIDLRYHEERLARELARACVERWSEDVVDSPSGAGDAPEPQNSLIELLPKRGYRVDSTRADVVPHAAVELGGRTFELFWEGASAMRPVKAGGAKGSMRRYLSTIRDTNEFLGSIVRANTTRYIQRETLDLIQRGEALLESEVRLPDRAGGLFKSLQQGCNRLEKPYETLAQSQLGRSEAPEEFPAVLAEAHARVEAVPSLPGAFLRLALIALGFGWLVAAPFLWGEGVPSSGLAQWVPWGAGVLFAVLVPSVPVTYAWRVRRAARAIGFARTTMLDAHLSQVCRTLVEALRAVGSKLCSEIEKKRAAIEALAKGLKERAWAIVDAESSENRQPIFPDAAVDRVVQPNLAQLVDDTYRGFRNLMAGVPLALDVDTWREKLSETARDSVGVLLARSTFREFVEGAGLTTDARLRLVENVIREARQPSLPLIANVVTPHVLCLLPLGWLGDTARLDDVHEHEAAVRTLVAVSVQHVDAEGEKP